MRIMYVDRSSRGVSSYFGLKFLGGKPPEGLLTRISLFNVAKQGIFLIVEDVRLLTGNQGAERYMPPDPRSET